MLRRVAMGGGVAALASSRDEGLIHYRVRVNTFERRCRLGHLLEIPASDVWFVGNAVS
jgi:hypothetical protein